jgi:hypothetical protein
MQKHDEQKTPGSVPNSRFWIERLKTSCPETVALVYNARWQHWVASETWWIAVHVPSTSIVLVFFLDTCIAHLHAPSISCLSPSDVPRHTLLVKMSLKLYIEPSGSKCLPEIDGPLSNRRCSFLCHCASSITPFVDPQPVVSASQWQKRKSPPIVLHSTTSSHMSSSSTTTHFPWDSVTPAVASSAQVTNYLGGECCLSYSSTISYLITSSIPCITLF